MPIERAHTNRLTVQRMLRLSDEQYNELVYAEGLRYLELYMANDAPGRAVLEALPSYWQWWTRQWARLDTEFLRRAKEVGLPLDLDPWTRTMARDFYDVVHDGSLLTHFRISRRVMLDAFKACRQPVAQ